VPIQDGRGVHAVLTYIFLSGKTAPAFIDDLTLHDPLHLPLSGHNLLAGRCLDQVSVGYLGQLLPPGSCRHDFITKVRQSLPPALDETPGPDTIWRVSAVCKLCRIHVQLKVDYTIRGAERPCPNVDNPVHHLIPAPWREQHARKEWVSKNPQSQDLIHAFECSSQTCLASVILQISPPILTPDAVHTLIDKDLLKQRTDEAFKMKAGQVEGMRPPTPKDVLLDLRLYIRNARTRAPRPISIDNKRFVVRFGPEGLACKDVLETLKFTYKVLWTCTPLRMLLMMMGSHMKAGRLQHQILMTRSHWKTL
jgi:ubiquitin carboxyl-terminal hydrolase 25